MNDHAQVFISYARKDASEDALRLEKELEKAGVSTWLDTSRIEGGASWTNAIEQAIERCRVLLALLSEGSFSSEICRAEQLRDRTLMWHALVQDYTRGKLGERLQATHTELIAAYNPRSEPWPTIEDDGYLYRHIAYHLKQAARDEEFRRLLLDFRWIQAKVWNLESGEEERTLTGHERAVWALAVTPDGNRALTGSDDGAVKVWNLESGEEERTLTGHERAVGYERRVNAVAVTPDGKRALTGSTDRTIKVWNLESGEFLAGFTGDTFITQCAVARDGVTIVAGEASGAVHSLRLVEMRIPQEGKRKRRQREKPLS